MCSSDLLWLAAFGGHRSGQPTIGDFRIEFGYCGVAVVVEHGSGRTDGTVVNPGVIHPVPSADLRGDRKSVV